MRVHRVCHLRLVRRLGKPYVDRFILELPLRPSERAIAVPAGRHDVVVGGAIRDF